MQKIFFLFVLFPLAGFTQDLSNWQHLDPETDSILGISTYKAYEYLNGRQTDTVVVAIIDNGAELTHEDLAGKFWENGNEIPDNQLDDDGNGYVDDINGWNFLGNPGGSNLKHETLELTRLYAQYHNMYNVDDSASFDTLQLAEYNKYLEIRKNYEDEVSQKKAEVALYRQILSGYHVSDSIIRKRLKKDVYTEADVGKIRSRKAEIAEAKKIILTFMALGIKQEVLESQIIRLTNDLNLKLNPDLKSREEIVKDNPDNLTDTIYGNNMLDVMGPDHGTGVTGALAALQNGTGIDGIARTVRIMILRVVPDGDERDKDVALAIRYAVRNGADIINCSFGKKYSAQPEFVRDAIAEAERKDVLIVHAAGNDSEDTDKTRYYPSGLLQDGRYARNWITVGASMPYDQEDLVAGFSNYGKTTVDVFAPGYGVTTCTLDGSYNKFSGTSISAPIVSGVAAVLKSCFPHLTAPQIKEIIIRSAYVPRTTLVQVPGKGNNTGVELSELCVSGGIVNLYRAVILAEQEYCDLQQGKSNSDPAIVNQ
ncbi:MAG: S8 family serine peptidase [Bacteroidales bacterium]|nr:S8 family serine peptidase [Bacteroidales bacterium]